MNGWNAAGHRWCSHDDYDWLRGHRRRDSPLIQSPAFQLQVVNIIFVQTAAGRGRGCARRRPSSAMDAYNRIRKIGKGAMGCASLVERKKDRHLVVVKEINVKGLSERDRQEAMKEVEVLKQLQHPHIVCMYEAFLQGGNLNIVMEYADAGDLAQLLRNANG
ncbi:MAG: protein kinase domain-containing protein, partial [Promethearchaeia archaeon]